MSENEKENLPVKRYFMSGLIAVVGLFVIYQVHYTNDLHHDFQTGLQFLRLVSENISQIYVTTRSQTIQSHFSEYSTIQNHLPPEKNLTDKYIIYRCNGDRLCGGLADRQKGIVTSYIMSQMLGRKFAVNMTKGCNFTNYVQPNQVDWLIDEDKLKGRRSKVVRFVDFGVFKFVQMKTTLEKLFSADIVYYEGNINYVHILMKDPLFINVKWANNRTLHEIYQIAFSHLFRFSNETRQRYVTFRGQTENKPLVCAHFRMGRSSTIPLDTNNGKNSPDVKKVILKLREIISDNSRLFVATDSNEVRDLMKKTFPETFSELEGKIVHVDRSGSTFDCSGLEKAILDQFILSTCQQLIISKSGFSRLAAVLRGRDEHLYLAGPNSVRRVVLNTKRDV